MTDSARPVPAYTRTLTVDEIEAALDAQLTAIEADAAREVDGRPVNFRLISIGELMKTEPAVFRVAEMAANPVGTACREAIQALGKLLFRVTGSTEAMLDVAHRVAERNPAKSYRRLDLMDKWWSGIGAGDDRWVA